LTSVERSSTIERYRPPPKFGNDCHRARDLATTPVYKITYKITYKFYKSVHNFKIFELRSTTEQMPALVLFLKFYGERKKRFGSEQLKKA
jgi:hypothetical protein